MPEDYEHHSRHERAHVQAVEAIFRDDAVDDHDECASRSADLSGRAAERVRSGSRQ